MFYLDNSATTPLGVKAKEKIEEMLSNFGNPSSLHSVGLLAEKEVTLAREIIAKSLSSRPDEIFFTSGGTESDNIAILSSAKKNSKIAKKIITTDSEHPAVSKTVDALEKEGYEVIRLSTRRGKIDLDEVERNADGVALVTIMRTNNETGAIYDIKAISDIVKKHSPRAIVHSDCVQAYMKERISLSSLGADIISVSGHKVHALKGVGVLAIRKGLVLPNVIFGGGQEKGVRSGTENTVGIASMGASVAELIEDKGREERVKELYSYTLTKLSEIDGVTFNIPENPSPYIVNISLVGNRSEVILHKLSQNEVYVSSGSACSSHSGKSHVLEAFGLSVKEQDSALRISFSSLNTKEDVDALKISLEEILSKCKMRNA